MSYTEELKLVDPPYGLTSFDTLFCLFYIQGHSPNEAAARATNDMLLPSQREIEQDESEFTRLARKTLKKANVKKYIQALNKKLEEICIADAFEIQRFLTDAIRTPIGAIDESSHLCQKKKVKKHYDRFGEELGESFELEMVSKMDAVKTLINMKGYNAPIKIDHTHKVGVMIVPMSNSVDDWEKSAADAQAKLVEETINV